MEKNFGLSNIQGTKDFFAYSFTSGALASSASASSTVNIEADSNFILQKLTVFATISNAAVTESTEVLPLVRLQITDNGSGRNLFNQPIAIPTLFGSGQRPFILPIPRLFRSNSSINFTYSNYSAGTSYVLDFTLSGVKIWG